MNGDLVGRVGVGVVLVTFGCIASLLLAQLFTLHLLLPGAAGIAVLGLAGYWAVAGSHEEA